MLYTIGGYGFSHESFFGALKSAGVDLLCDIRQHRGMRGSRFAFLNSTRIQNSLAESGIAYLHLKTFAPTADIRASQKQEDAYMGVQKRNRDVLGHTFVSAYKRQILDRYSPDDFIGLIPEDARHPCLFCIERHPAACHRSLLAGWLFNQINAPIIHLLP